LRNMARAAAACGRVYLKLADATPAGAERGVAMLRKLVG